MPDLKSLTLFCSIALSGALAHVSPALPLPQAAKSAQRAKAKTGIAFVRGNAGELVMPNGIQLDFTDYRSSDGVGLRVFYQDFRDPSEAAQAFDKEIAEASKVVRRSDKLDSTGEVVGQRAEVVLPPNWRQHTFFAVMWTDGRKYHEIRSRSLRHILELEKDYKY